MSFNVFFRNLSTTIPLNEKPGRPSFVRAVAQTIARVRGASPVPANVRGGEELPRAGHRVARFEAAEVRVRRCRAVSNCTINVLWGIGGASYPGQES